MDEKSTVLIIDDMKTNLDILLDFLDDNYAVVPALNAKSALEILDQIKIDLILSNIIMPQMDGFELCEKLKSNPKYRDIPVVFITSKDDTQTIEKAYDVGGVDLITKPFEKELVIHELEYILNDMPSIKI